MLKTSEIQIRDPFIVPVHEENQYYMFGTTDPDCWGMGTGFDAFITSDLENWQGPIAAFRPPAGFWADRNFWAPEVHRYRDRYFMFASFRPKASAGARKYSPPTSPAARTFSTATSP